MLGLKVVQRELVDVQALAGLSARGTAEALIFDLRWKGACDCGMTKRATQASTFFVLVQAPPGGGFDDPW